MPRFYRGLPARKKTMALSKRRLLRPETPVSHQSIDNDDGSKKKWKLSTVRLLRYGALMFFGLVITFLSSDHLPTEAPSLSSGKNLKTAKAKVLNLRAEAKKKFQNCTLSFVPPPPRKELDWRKPLWAPALPASGSSSPSKKGDILKDLVNSFTGLKGGMKNYHMSIRNKLKRCKGVSETAACSQGHPYVPVGPEDKTNDFQSLVIFSMRNVMTQFPAGHIEKAIAYHGATRQPPEEEWRKMRNEWFKSSVEGWKTMIQWWRNADYYKIALYLPYEKMLDVEAGPALVQRLADVFSQAGFDVAPPQDISCIWYQSIKREWARQDSLMEYVPGYTEEQRDFLLQKMKDFINEVQDDEELTTILKNYLTEIQEELRIDMNQTGTQ